MPLSRLNLVQQALVVHGAQAQDLEMPLLQPPQLGGGRKMALKTQ